MKHSYSMNYWIYYCANWCYLYDCANMYIILCNVFWFLLFCLLLLYFITIITIITFIAIELLLLPFLIFVFCNWKLFSLRAYECLHIFLFVCWALPHSWQNSLHKHNLLECFYFHLSNCLLALNITSNPLKKNVFSDLRWCQNILCFYNVETHIKLSECLLINHMCVQTYDTHYILNRKAI